MLCPGKSEVAHVGSGQEHLCHLHAAAFRKPKAVFDKPERLINLFQLETGIFSFKEALTNQGC